MNAKLYSTKYGQIIRKIPENEFIIEFGNLSWKLTLYQFRMMKNFIKRLDGQFYEELNKDSFYRRKIRIPIKTTNLSILLNQDELLDLKTLLEGIPDEVLEKDDLFDQLYKTAENQYDRLDDFPSSQLIHVPMKFHLN